MKKFILRFFGFIIVVLIINQIIKAAIPYWWGNPYYAEKIEYLKKEKSNYNLIFLGSSRIYRQIDPEIFDRVVSKDHNILSFNLASPSTFVPESYYLLENFLRHNNLNIEYILIELQLVIPVADRNLHNSRSFYWMNIKEYFFTLKYCLSRINCDPEIWHKIGNYTYSFVDNILNIGATSEFINGKKHNCNSLGKTKNGYVPIESELNKYQKERREKFLEDVTILYKKSHWYKNRFLKRVEPDFTEKQHSERITKLINLANNKDIRLIFVLPPLVDKYENFQQLYFKIPETNRLGTVAK